MSVAATQFVDGLDCRSARCTFRMMASPRPYSWEGPRRAVRGMARTTSDLARTTREQCLAMDRRLVRALFSSTIEAIRKDPTPAAKGLFATGCSTEHSPPGCAPRFGSSSIPLAAAGRLDSGAPTTPSCQRNATSGPMRVYARDCAIESWSQCGLAEPRHPSPMVQFRGGSPTVLMSVRRRGRVPDNLTQVAERCPISSDGLLLSIGSTRSLDERLIGEVSALLDAVQAPWHSDHLCLASAHERARCWQGIGTSS